MYTTAELFIMAFSPPYGDSTSSTSTISSVQTGFRPLTGMVPYGKLHAERYGRFRPLTGMVRFIDGYTYDKIGFRPLTGMVRS